VTSTIASHYSDILFLHIGCVALSGTLFTLRGVLRVCDIAAANHNALRIASYVIDSILLSAAILLAAILGQYPFVNGWLTTKVLLILVYVLLGSAALRGARTPAGRLVALVAALSVFALIIGVAITHDPLGWLSPMRT
jgi:uncharacterized membrane protein SirB2